MKQVAVILSGCGFLDGGEIHESVLTLLAIEQAGAQYHCFAPNMMQTCEVNHLTEETQPNTQRNVLVESARIARGQIADLKSAKADDFDALIIPGGYGAALNLSNFAQLGATASAHPDLIPLIQAMLAQHKPLGFICIAPNLIPLCCESNITLTIGHDPQIATTLEQMGAKHQACSVDEIVVDDQHKIVSTPAYMVGQSISEAAHGISALVKRVLDLT